MSSPQLTPNNIELTPLQPLDLPQVPAEHWLSVTEIINGSAGLLTGVLLLALIYLLFVKTGLVNNGFKQVNFLKNSSLNSCKSALYKQLVKLEKTINTSVNKTVNKSKNKPLNSSQNSVINLTNQDLVAFYNCVAQFEQCYKSQAVKEQPTNALHKHIFELKQQLEAVAFSPNKAGLIGLAELEELKHVIKALKPLVGVKS